MVAAMQSQPFFREDDLAGALVVATVLGAIAAEWLVTLRERRANGESGPASTLGEVTLDDSAGRLGEAICCSSGPSSIADGPRAAPISLITVVGVEASAG